MILEKLFGASGGEFGRFKNSLSGFVCFWTLLVFSLFSFWKPLLLLYWAIIICPAEPLSQHDQASFLVLGDFGSDYPEQGRCGGVTGRDLTCCGVALWQRWLLWLL